MMSIKKDEVDVDFTDSVSLYRGEDNYELVWRGVIIEILKSDAGGTRTHTPEFGNHFIWF